MVLSDTGSMGSCPRHQLKGGAAIVFFYILSFRLCYGVWIGLKPANQQRALSLLSKVKELKCNVSEENFCKNETESFANQTYYIFCGTGFLSLLVSCHVRIHQVS